MILTVYHRQRFVPSPLWCLWEKPAKEEASEMRMSGSGSGEGGQDNSIRLTEKSKARTIHGAQPI